MNWSNAELAEMKRDMLQNRIGHNSRESFEVSFDSVGHEDSSIFVNATLTEFDGPGSDVVKQSGKMKFGIKYFFGTEYFGEQKNLPTLWALLTCWAVAELGHAVREFKFDIPLNELDRNFISKTLEATSSWHRHFFKASKPALTFSDKSRISGINVPTLDYNRAVLGASGGKESTINEIILKGAGYEVIPITFSNSHDIHATSTSLEIFWNDDEDAQKIFIPKVIPLGDVAFDIQGMFSIIRYGLLAFTAARRGAGVLAVGTEFGCSKVWKAGESDNEFDVHDLSVDEGAYVCRQIESFLHNNGIPVRIVAPTSVLHELGILRALTDHGFDLRELKSCWMAETLGVHYCGSCLKCQRIKKYVSRLYPGSELDKSLDFPDIGVSAGTLMSYSIQYHLTEDRPDLPWHNAIVMDSDGMSLQDGWNGGRIIKFLREHMGFTETITDDQIQTPLEFRLANSKKVRQLIKDATHLDFSEMHRKNPEILHGGHLQLPFEDLYYQVLGDDPEFHASLPDTLAVYGLISRFDAIPVWREDMDSWWTLNITGLDENHPSFNLLELPEEAKAMPLFKTWMAYDTILGGLSAMGVKGF